MIGEEDSLSTLEFNDHFKILPSTIELEEGIEKIGAQGSLVKNNFSYRSDNNKEWLTEDQFRKMLQRNIKKFVTI